MGPPKTIRPSAGRGAEDPPGGSGRGERVEPRWREDPAAGRPMLATLADPPLQDDRLVYEPKYDGIRALIEIQPTGGAPRGSGGGRRASTRPQDAEGRTPQVEAHAARRTSHRTSPVARGTSTVAVRIRSRLGNDKTAQFPEIAAAAADIGRSLPGPVLIDGEIVALDEQGRPAGFQRLQGRMHLTGAADIARASRGQPVAFIAFDLLRDGDLDLRALPLAERRARLEARFPPRLRSATLRLSDIALGDGRPLLARAHEEGWEGLIVKDAGSPYQSGRRSPAWRKLKLPRRQEFVIGGWTEPRQTRQHFGALLLGVYREGAKEHDDAKEPEGTKTHPGRTVHPGVPEQSSKGLVYVGHTGTGFDQRELLRLSRLLRERETRESPFATRVRTNERAHWVRPELVAEIRFTEWTADGRLRHPAYLGLRDDVDPRSVRREPVSAAASVPAAEPAPDGLPRAPSRGLPRATSTGSPRAPSKNAARPSGQRLPAASKVSSRTTARDPSRAESKEGQVLEQLQELESAGRDGTILLPGGEQLRVTNLRKVFWPDLGITKGELLRYYVRVAPVILPAVADRPLVMRRFPNGIQGKAFYQQRVREDAPEGVRVEVLPAEIDPIGEQGARRLVGGSLITLLHMAQIACISQDPWFSRVESPLEADHVALDLDPTQGTPFARVLDVARWVRDELQRFGVPGVPKTSGKSGLHIYIPLPPRTSYDSGRLLCQIMATIVASKHPKVATIERKVAARPPGTVYVDYLQNILGKTLATAYSARPSEFAGVSAPLAWEDLDAKVDPHDFTLRTFPDRLREVGDLWARLRSGPAADLERLLRSR